MVQEVLGLYGHAIQAILFYGSCFRKGDDADGIVDMYLLVNGYRRTYRRSDYAFLNKLLPPNVFYLKVPYEGRMHHAKYAVFSFGDFQRGTSMRWFQSYLWGRLAQPVGLVYARNNQVKALVHNALARAVITFITRMLPVMPSQFTARDLWCTGLGRSYGAELRAERSNQLVDLFDAEPHYYEELTRTAMGVVPFSVRAIHNTHRAGYRTQIPALTRLSCRFAWTVRGVQGKVLSILRLFKGLFTFQGGLNYILWKIERHSGINVQLEPRLRRVPVVGVWVLFWRLYRRGAFR
jgi:hypothetical protein